MSCNRLLDTHSIVILGATIIYVFWNLGQTKTDHYVYAVLKWDGAGSVILAIGAIIFAVAVFWLASFITVGRDRLAKKWNSVPPIASSQPGVTQAGAQSSTGAGKAQPETASSAAGDAVEWSQVYPVDFTDDEVAYPCITCKKHCGCCPFSACQASTPADNSHAAAQARAAPGAQPKDASHV